MGRSSYSTRTEADGLNKISTSFLNKYGYFSGGRSGVITWTHGYSGSQDRVSIESSTSFDEKYLRISYAQTSHETGEKTSYDYKIPLVTTPCNFGGKRYWFICPWYKGGVYCGKRVGVLYMDGKYFACRHCYELTYNSRNLSGWAKSLGTIVSDSELEELEVSLKRWHYRGKPTRRYQRFLKKREKANRSWIGFAAAINRRLKGK